MYQEHPVFASPNNPNVKIWRYLDFTKFVSMLLNKSLFFAKANSLDDKFEGAYPAIMFEDPDACLANFPKESREGIVDKLRIGAHELPKTVLINSWHMNEFESAAMWKLYSQGKDGVAIQSTFMNLKDCFIDTYNWPIFIGVVKYIDYNTDTIPLRNALRPFIYKRKSFLHENELRAIIPTFKNDRSPNFDVGTDIPVDLNCLIQNIYVSPSSPLWFAELVKMITKKLDLEKEVIHSDLSKDPVF